MELNQIRSFLEVATAGGVTRAAERLLLTQPAVTQHIQSLEREFNAALFDRTGKGMRLTAAGRVLQRHFQEGLSSLQAAKTAVEAAEAGVTGRLAVGSAITLSSSGLADCLRRLHEDHPGISLTIRTARSETIVSLVLDGQLDLGIAAAPARVGTLRITPLYEQAFALATPANHPLAGKTISDRQAATLPMIGCSPGPWVGLESGLTRFSSSATRIESDTLESIKGLVIAGLGCAVLPIDDITRELAAGTISQVRVRRTPMPSRVISLVQRKDTSPSAGARAFMQILREHYLRKGNAVDIDSRPIRM